MEAKQQSDAERVAAIRARAARYDLIGNSAALFLLDRLAAVGAERDTYRRAVQFAFRKRRGTPVPGWVDAAVNGSADAAVAKLANADEWTEKPQAAGTHWVYKHWERPEPHLGSGLCEVRMSYDGSPIIRLNSCDFQADAFPGALFLPVTPPVPTPIPDSHFPYRPRGADESASAKSASVAVPETKEKP